MATMHISHCGFNWQHERHFLLDRPHGHYEWVVIQVTSSGWWWEHEHAPPREAGLCVIMPPDLPHRYGNDHRPFTNHWFHAAGLDPGDLPLSQPFSVADPAAVSQAFHNLQREWTTRAQDWEAACDAHVQLLMISLRRGQALAARPRAADDRNLLALRSRLRADPGIGWTVARLAAEAGLSPARFRVRYRNAFGTSPMDDLLAARLDHARALLLDGLTVAAAAQRSGFHDLSYFHRQYRRRLGTTPAGSRDDDPATP